MPLLTEEAKKPPTAADVPNIWTFDGGWRDIYVLSTNIENWKQFLAFAMSYPHSFQVDGDAAAMPDAAEILRNQDHAHLLSISVQTVTLNCHFFDEGQIELDVDPREVRGTVQHEGILNFIAGMARAVGKPVMLTPENEIEYPLLSYEPSADRWRWRTDWSSV